MTVYVINTHKAGDQMQLLETLVPTIDVQYDPSTSVANYMLRPNQSIPNLASSVT